MITLGGNDRFHKRAAIDEIQRRGRWKARSSCARYEKHAKLLRVVGKIEKKVLRKAAGAAVRFRTAVLAAIPKLDKKKGLRAS